MIEVHCHKCNRFIGKADSRAMLYCKSCKQFRVIKIDNGVVVSLPFTQTRVSVG